MVHRDRKPHNLMVTADGTTKILDIGMAPLTTEADPAIDAVDARSDLTAAGAVMETPDFISPEQANDARQVNIRSGIYSLEATLDNLLSGQTPFADGSVMHKPKIHAEAEPTSLDSVRDDVTKELVSIVSTMMAKDTDQRYLTPKEVADALESFLRTWKSDEAKLPRQVPPAGGNMSGSRGKKPRVSDAGCDWRLVMARILLAIACIPVALISYGTRTVNAKVSGEDILNHRNRFFAQHGCPR